MRHLILALMIALLPLRGWAGDVMAVRMAAPALAAPASAADQALPDPTAALAMHATLAMHADCADGAGADHASTQNHCGNCTACETCHSVALIPPFMQTAPSALTSSPPQARHAHLASAERAPGFKPPIS